MSQAASRGRFPALSWLLLVTSAALLLAVAHRLPRIVADDLPARVAPFPPSLPTGSELALAPLADIAPGTGPAPARPTVGPAANAETPAALGAGGVEVLDALAAELRRHQAALAEREQSIELREAVVQSVETRVREQVAKLEQLKGELERLLGQVSADQQARIAQLIKVYEAMKAKSAAAIFDPMALDLLLPIVRGMRETKVAAIVADMDPAKARALTAELARERPLPTAP